jgi:RND family efflux transporter MFP subunit
MSRRSAGLLFLALACLACGGGKAPDEEIATTGEAPVTVQPAVVTDVEQTVSVTGTVQSAPGTDLMVVAPLAGRIAEIPPAAGDHVRRGDLLVRFDIPSLGEDQAAKEAAVRSAQARVATARAAVARLTTLVEHGVAAQRELDDARREATQADADLDAARAARVAAADLARRAVVRAPFAGVVAQRSHNPGDLVDAAAGDPILRLVDPSRVEVVASVPAAVAPSVRAGNAARIKVPGGSGDVAAGIPGVVATAPSVIDPVTSTATARIGLRSPTFLPPGLAVEITLATALHKQVVAIPAAAVVQEGPEAFVFVVDAQHKAHRRSVVLGISDGVRTEVLRGVTAGERVVVEGQLGLPDGATVAEKEP